MEQARRARIEASKRQWTSPDSTTPPTATTTPPTATTTPPTATTTPPTATTTTADTTEVICHNYLLSLCYLIAHNLQFINKYLQVLNDVMEFWTILDTLSPYGHLFK